MKNFYSCSAAFHALYPSTSHKNADVSSKALGLIANSCLSLLKKEELEDEDGTRPSLASNLVFVISKGLDAKLPLTRDASKAALKRIKDLLGDESAFDNLLEATSLPNVKINEIKRITCVDLNTNFNSVFACNVLVTPSSSSSSSSSSSCSSSYSKTTTKQPLRGNGPNSSNSKRVLSAGGSRPSIREQIALKAKGSTSTPSFTIFEESSNP